MALTRLRLQKFLNLRHQPWPTSSAIAPTLSSTHLVEEEKTPYYRPERFYPVRLGEILHERYQIATKLGYGSGSTVWLARDLFRYRWQSERYVAIKVTSTLHFVDRDEVGPELAILKRISETNPRHEGWEFVRKLVDHFNIRGTDREHLCLVFEPLREPLWLYSQRFVGNVIPPGILKIILQMVLHGLDYLHRECQIIHTDLKPDNIMVTLEDLSLLTREATNECNDPLPQKHSEERTIYLSRNDYGPFLKPVGVVRITDFNLAVLGNDARFGTIQADDYRAPEVILDSGYTYSADIWNLGVMLWDLLEGTQLFPIDDSNTKGYDENQHLAHMTRLLGPIPKNLVTGRRASQFYDADGNLHKPELIPQDLSFEGSIHSMEGEEKELFIKFVRRMIKWSPQERSTAKELLDDPWLYKSSS